MTHSVSTNTKTLSTFLCVYTWLASAPEVEWSAPVRTGRIAPVPLENSLE